MRGLYGSGLWPIDWYTNWRECLERWVWRVVEQWHKLAYNSIPDRWSDIYRKSNYGTCPQCRSSSREMTFNRLKNSLWIFRSLLLSTVRIYILYRSPRGSMRSTGGTSNATLRWHDRALIAKKARSQLLEIWHTYCSTMMGRHLSRRHRGRWFQSIVTIARPPSVKIVLKWSA